MLAIATAYDEMSQAIAKYYNENLYPKVEIEINHGDFCHIFLIKIKYICIIND